MDKNKRCEHWVVTSSHGASRDYAINGEVAKRQISADALIARMLDQQGQILTTKSYGGVFTIILRCPKGTMEEIASSVERNL